MRACMGRMQLVAAVGAATLSAASTASADIIISEVMSQSSATGDWIELTNTGTTAVDLSGWLFDDKSANPLLADSIAGVSSIAAGESVIILRIGDDSQTSGLVADFRAFWGGIDGVQIGTLDSTSAALGKGDGVTIFDADLELVAQMFYGDGIDTDPDDLIPDSHAGKWAGGMKWDSANVADNGYVAGDAFNGSYGIRASAMMNNHGVYEYGSPGESFIIPAPGALALVGFAGLAARRRRRA